MNAGIRSRARRDWPPGLEEPKPGYFVWKPPAKCRPYIEQQIPAGGIPIGRVPLEVAKQLVNDRILAIYRKAMANNRNPLEEFFDRPARDDSLSAWIAIYLQKITTRNLAPATLKNIARRLENLPEDTKRLPVSAVTTRHIAEHLDSITSDGVARSTRTTMLDCFNVAISAGWRADNPVSPTRGRTVRTDRQRLSLDAFREILAWSEANQPAFAARAFSLAIVTALRREDLASLRFAQVRDGYLWVEPAKGRKYGVKIAIPMDLRLQAIGLSVGDVISSCRDAVVSRHVLHHTRPAGCARAGSHIRAETLTEMFAEARYACGLGTGAHPPTLHEIRSLSLRLYDAQGVNVQALAGHRSAEMTAIYRDVRGSEWVKVS